MKVVKTLADLKKMAGNCLAITIGKFDGIHLGHFAILSKLKLEAKRLNCPCVIVTFASHPQKEMILDSGLKCLIDAQSKRDCFENSGIDFIAELDFDNEISGMSPTQFLENLSVGLNHFSIVLGDDFKFGKGRNGSLATIDEYFRSHEGRLLVVQSVSQNGKRISSTLIRELIFSGNIKEANSYLGRSYCLRGIKCSGHKIGRELGSPTINLKNITTLLPKAGVYATNIRVAGVQYRSISYIGNRGTFQGDELVFESNLFDFNLSVEDGSLIEVDFLLFIREDRVFAGRDELIKQIEKDKKIALAI